ncbi:MAG: helix-turn-helix domain-containing protein [Acidimicrobiales bacterium]
MPDPRDRILDAAAELFYREGVSAVGVDTIVRHAGVAKATLYNHFRSKNELVAAWLERRDLQWFEMLYSRLELAVAADPQAGRIVCVFDALHDWFSMEDFRGCAFINTAAELPDPAHPAQQIIAKHKQQLRSDLERWANEHPVDDPTALAEEVFLVIEGSIVAAVMRRSAEPARVGRLATLHLLHAHQHG